MEANTGNSKRKSISSPFTSDVADRPRELSQPWATGPMPPPARALSDDQTEDFVHIEDVPEDQEYSDSYDGSEDSSQQPLQGSGSRPVTPKKKNASVENIPVSDKPRPFDVDLVEAAFKAHAQSFANGLDVLPEPGARETKLLMSSDESIVPEVLPELPKDSDHSQRDSKIDPLPAIPGYIPPTTPGTTEEASLTALATDMGTQATQVVNPGADFPLSPAAEQEGLIVDIMRKMDRLRYLRKKIVNLRQHVDMERRRARKQRGRARLAQKALLEAQLALIEAPKASANKTTIKLADQAKSATKDSRQYDKRLAHVERRLTLFEARVQEQEHDVYERMKRLAKAMDIQTRDDVSEHDSDAPSSGASFRSEEELPENYQRYLSEVSKIGVIRERMHHFEVAHRQALGQREEAFEDRMAKRKRQEQVLHQAPSVSDNEFYSTEFRRNEEYLKSYFGGRMELAENLLNTRDRAMELRLLCIQEGNQPEDPDELNALEEALRYNIEGPIGRMYSVVHEGDHRGVLPLELIRVPYVHTSQRITHWLYEVCRQTASTKLDELRSTVESPPAFRDFELYFDILQGNIAKRNTEWTSASDYHRVSEEDPAEESNSMTGRMTVMPDMMHWTCWAGEYVAGENPASLPDIGDPTDDPLGRWVQQETRSLQ